MTAEVKDIGGYPFKMVCDIQPIEDSNGVVLSFFPQSRYKNANNLPLHKYGKGPFCQFKITSGLRSSGVYAIFVTSELKYIGRCGPRGLSWRFGDAQYGRIQPRNCFKGGQEPNCRINNLIYLKALKNSPIVLWFFETPKFAELENELRAHFRAPWNLR